MTFSELNLIEPIQKALAEEGYTNPTPIQEQAIPYLLDRRDLLGCAQTGTGKTAAFAIPILQHLANDQRTEPMTNHVKTLVLTPTRELALQIAESFNNYGRHLNLKTLVIFGGVGQKPQTDALARRVDILVATPGRLLDLMNQGFIKLNHIKFFVLDEADRMLDMGFVHDVKKVITKLPPRRQSLFFSATMPPEIQALADTILSNPAKVEVTPVSSTADTINQSLYFVDKNDKNDLLIHLLKDKTIETCLVFTRTKHGADKVAKKLNSVGIRADAIHGNKSQNARVRALGDFKDRRIRVLVATDIAARGIDIDELTHVVNFEIPNIPESYVHRIGRTGRAGASGIAFSFCDNEEEPIYVRDIQKLIGKDIPVDDQHPYHLDMVIPTKKMPAPAKPKPQQNRRPSFGNNGPRPQGNSGARPVSKGERNQSNRRFN